MCLSSINYFSAHSELKQEANNYARSLKSKLNIDSRKILRPTSSTGLFSPNITYVMDQRNYPSHIKLYVEPEVMIRGVVRQLDYAIVDHRDPAIVEK
ncbi:hypothetical protein Smar_0582 [Staphylothermus marinus F1]|uniref:Uncharacterized protein n=1 Tax=Staphylothermus marinus (strain ATCC 43588 / DSM 3639 / JCM 9404 / F1) TaxID=399550 RepID=A3DM29_STAMF|nr:hypothetical protein [Staphylothermus marinus]ABN69689.1 hypothetical protein Smar_0582 [Staphylothermus marinus F1]